MDEIDWDNLPATTAPSIPVCMQGFNNEEMATRLRTEVCNFIGLVGSFVNLTTLDGITLAVDFDVALAQFNQGMEGLAPLGRSNTEAMQGVAKSCGVIRDGEEKTHIIFDASVVLPLILGDEGDMATTPEARLTAWGIIAHECGHVQLNAQMAAVFPECRLGARIDSYERALLFQVAHICWEEYAVCRLSAPFAANQNETHGDVILTCVTAAQARAQQHINEFRIHGEINRMVGEVGTQLFEPLKAAAYMLGGMDGEGTTWDEYPEVRTAIEDGGYTEHVRALHVECQNLWDSQSEWSEGEDILAPLMTVFKDMFETNGVQLYTNDDGSCRVFVI